jgi:hypothetical protein
MALRGPAPSAPRAAAPASLPAAVAAAGLGTVSEEEDGAATVTFPTPPGVPAYVPFSTAPITVSREEAPPETPAAAAAPVPAAAPAAAPPAAAGGGKGDDDEEFDRLLGRLRRELVLEQEQRGQPFHEL